jgi:glycosyltransferase involved in cell wall biosynthesis
VIDGGSSDSTPKIVTEHGVDVFVSEPDEGIYDAMNKGIAHASGDIIGILNSDDFYANSHVIETVVKTLQKTGAASCYGDLQYVDFKDTSKVIRAWKAGEYKKGKLKYGWVPPHPSFFVRKGVYEKYGDYDKDFSIAADYEFMLRLLAVYNVSTIHIPETLVQMRPGGHSAKSIKQRIAGWKELRKAWHKHNISIPWYFSIARPLLKLTQFL